MGEHWVSTGHIRPFSMPACYRRGPLSAAALLSPPRCWACLTRGAGSGRRQGPPQGQAVAVLAAASRSSRRNSQVQWALRSGAPMVQVTCL